MYKTKSDRIRSDRGGDNEIRTRGLRVANASTPGRNYKLLPALATNSPPDCLLNASTPGRNYKLLPALATDSALCCQLNASLPLSHTTQVMHFIFVFPRDFDEFLSSDTATVKTLPSRFITKRNTCTTPYINGVISLITLHSLFDHLPSLKSVGTSAESSSILRKSAFISLRHGLS